MKLQVDVQYAFNGAGVPDETSIATWARAAFRGHPGVAWELVVRIVDKKESATLNRRYRHKSGPTNVLSFAYDSAETPLRGQRELLGDIVICGPIVEREAAARGGDAVAHWAHMVVHGIMHLRGYDHVDEDEARIMEHLESQVMQRLGFADPYA